MEFFKNLLFKEEQIKEEKVVEKLPEVVATVKPSLPVMDTVQTSTKIAASEAEEFIKFIEQAVFDDDSLNTVLTNYSSLETIIPNESMRMAAALKTSGMSKEEIITLLNSANNKVANEIAGFDAAYDSNAQGLERSYQERVKNIEITIASHENSIKIASENISKLQTEKTDLSLNMNKTINDMQDSKSKFHFAAEQVSNLIKKYINTIQ